MTTAERRIHILLIADDAADARRLQELAFGAAQVKVRIRWEQTLASGLARISSAFDVILLDLSLKECSGRHAFERVRAQAESTPVVVLAPRRDQSEAPRFIRSGAQDHLVREELTSDLLARSLLYSVERWRSQATLRAAEADYRNLFERSLDGVYRSSPEGKLLAANPALVRMLGYDSKEELFEIDLGDLYVDRADRGKWMERAANQNEIRNAEARLQRKDGKQVIALESTRVVRTDDEVLYYEGTLTDITERKQHESRLAYLASHDALTGLLNRRGFLDELDRELARSRRHGTTGILLWIDLDRFKQVNDRFGHRVGDEVLVNTARLLREQVRQTDIAARLGGDEFAVLVPEAGPDQAHKLVGAILDRLKAAAVNVDGQTFHVSGCVGLSLIMPDSPSSEALLDQADRAMYLAKQDGRGRSRMYLPESDKRFGVAGG